MDLLRPNFNMAPMVKAMINIGALLDIPTGTFLEGRHGEMVLNGGLANLTGFVGIGNQFKSTFMLYMIITAMIRICELSTANIYDTEINVHISRLKQLMTRYIELQMEDLVDQGRMTVTDKAEHLADEWFDLLKEWLQNKRKNKEKILRNTPFLERDGSLMQIPVPTFGAIDSFSEFITADVVKMQDDNSLGDSKANTLYMKQGQQKNRFLMEIPPLAQSAYHYTLMTAHLGEKIEMDPHNPSPKALQHLTGNLKIKGAPTKFTFLMNNCWWCYNAAVLKTDDSARTPLYPRDSDDNMKNDTDLNVVTVRLLRGKSGPSGMGTEIVISQSEGVLPSLTEFHYLRNRKENPRDTSATAKRYGFDGNLQNYSLDLLPDVKLSRTSIRGKIDSDPRLVRALNITAEMCQMSELWHNMDELLCTPKQLYDDLKAAGYDWEMILSKTRGWWTLDNDDPRHELLFLSSMDLLRMRKGEYHPFWLEADKKTLKKEYQK
jgi:hypothetical protein